MLVSREVDGLFLVPSNFVPQRQPEVKTSRFASALRHLSVPYVLVDGSLKISIAIKLH